jgi:hypothetical protein
MANQVTLDFISRISNQKIALKEKNLYDSDLAKTLKVILIANSIHIIN